MNKPIPEHFPRLQLYIKPCPCGRHHSLMAHVELHHEDAALAKAAPKLLAALKRLIAPLEFGVIEVDAWADAQKAIAEAEGKEP